MGTISAYETAAEKRYRVRYRQPDHSQTDKRGFKTKRSAQLFLASTGVSKSRGEYIEESAALATIGALGRTWLSSQTHLKPSAYEPIEIAWRLYVAPRWGAAEIGRIQHSEVQTWVSQLGAGTAITLHPSPGARSATHIIRAYGVLAAILDVEVKDRRILVNSARGVTLPRKKKKPHTYLSHEQVDLLATSATTHGTVILTLAYTGLRWGEVTGLRVRDVDLVRRRLAVRENAVRVGGKILLGTPKSHEARTVPFPPFLTERLALLCADKTPTRSCSATGYRTSARRRLGTAGWSTPSNVPGRSIRPSHASRPTTSGTPPRAWPCPPARTSKRYSGCSATPRPRGPSTCTRTSSTTIWTASQWPSIRPG
ncbi:site-specific integrase [Cryobacterium sp. TMS1-13-1]|nr:site-specific integrase [Cryobacterium sp. TMS1-13-1]